MSSSPRKIVCVVPTIRPESHASFVKAWRPLFEKHDVTLVTLWDGDSLRVTVDANDELPEQEYSAYDVNGYEEHRDLFCRRTDACRNLGFIVAAQLGATHVLTLDDDVTPCGNTWEHDLHDPIQSHLDALDRRVPLSWMNTAHDTDLYVRGVPYGVRSEAPVMLSHGVWVGVPDFDGETQLRLETCPNCVNAPLHRSGGGCPMCRDTGKRQLPYSLPYYVGPIPRGVLFPLCGMNVMVRREALPYFYFAPMGQDCGVTSQCPMCVNSPLERSGGGCPKCNSTGQVPALHRFADIFMGVFLKREFDRLGWACVTGYSTVLHTRASDAKKNVEQEKLGREWMEWMWNGFQPPPAHSSQAENYFLSYADKRRRYADLVNSILGK